MAGDPQNFGHCVPQIDGNTVAFVASCEFANENADVDVLTIAEGFAGQTPGPDKLVTRVQVHVPLNGSLKKKLQKMELAKTVVDHAVQEYPTGQKMKNKGFIRNVGGGSSVGSNSSFTYEHHGIPSNFE